MQADAEILYRIGATAPPKVGYVPKTQSAPDLEETPQRTWFIGQFAELRIGIVRMHRTSACRRDALVRFADSYLLGKQTEEVPWHTRHIFNGSWMGN